MVKELYKTSLPPPTTRKLGSVVDCEYIPLPFLLLPSSLAPRRKLWAKKGSQSSSCYWLKKGLAAIFLLLFSNLSCCPLLWDPLQRISFLLYSANLRLPLLHTFSFPINFEAYYKKLLGDRDNSCEYLTLPRNPKHLQLGRLPLKPAETGRKHLKSNMSPARISSGVTAAFTINSWIWGVYRKGCSNTQKPRNSSWIFGNTLQGSQKPPWVVIKKKTAIIYSGALKVA